MPIVTGVTHDPDTDAPLTGLWAVRRFTSFSDPAEFVTDPEHGWSFYAAPGRASSLSLPATTGDELYWAQFTSSDGETTLGPYLFTLTADRTWDDIIANPAPTPSAGGGDLNPSYVEAGNVQLSTSTYTKVPWVESADLPLRDDQFTLDGDTLTCIQAGTYRIDLYILPTAGTPGTPGQIEVEALFEVNEATKGPAYNFYPRVNFRAEAPGTRSALVCSLPQAFEVGDELVIQAKVYEIGATVLDPGVVTIPSTSGCLMLTRTGD